MGGGGGGGGGGGLGRTWHGGGVLSMLDDRTPFICNKF